MSAYDHTGKDYRWTLTFQPDPWTPEVQAWYDQVEADLLAARWIFARTMPKNPHEYTLRREWPDIERFTSAVRFIRQHSSVYWFWRKPYIQLRIDDHLYWTMGSPPEETELINRKVLSTRGDES